MAEEEEFVVVESLGEGTNWTLQSAYSCNRWLGALDSKLASMLPSVAAGAGIDIEAEAGHIQG